MQKDGVLGGRAWKDVLMQPFQGGKVIMINIPIPKDGGTWQEDNPNIILKSVVCVCVAV